MAAFYQTFIANRLTEPDPTILLSQLRALDASAGVIHDPGGAYLLKKATAWLPGHITAAQGVLDTAPAVTPQSIAQGEIDRWPIATRALVLTLIDQINVLRTNGGLGTITPAQALAAVRNKAATL